MAAIEISPSSTGGGGGGTGTVTSVALTSGTTGTDINVTGSPITTFGTLTLNVPVASALATGKLSAADWATFNGKQAPLVSGTNIKTINGNSILGSGDLVISASAGGSNTNVQYNSGGSFAGTSQFNFDGNNVAIGKTVGSKKLEVSSTDQCVATFGNNITGAGITFTDTTTTDAETVGVGAFGDLLCLRGGGNAAGTVQISDDFVNFRGHELRNFIPLIDTDAVGVTINSTNQDSYCGIVLEVTGAITVTIDDSVRNGFSISVIQMDANNATFAASGGSLTLRNRQGHTQTNGQWATITLFKNGNNLILAGDTA